MNRRFVVVSGVPGSGKTTLAQRLAPLLELPVIDKDDILEQLFERKGTGDTAWRRMLSRESDQLFRKEAERSAGAILVSFWHQPGMPHDSGTPTDWLHGLSRNIVQLHCQCPSSIAALRYRQRRRHPGHLDDEKSPEELLRGIQSIADLQALEVGPKVSCDTSPDVDVNRIASLLWKSFERP